MAANANDLFMEVGSPGTATTLSSPGYESGVSTAVTVGSTSNWPTTTGIIFAIDEATVDSDGNEVRVDGTYNEFEGVVASATSVTGVDYVGGDAERTYAAGALTRVYIPVSAERENRIVQGISVEHTQTGRHSMTSPKVITDISDTNGNELIKVTATSSAVNEFTVANAATGNGPTQSVTGGDTNIDYKIATKGTGLFKVNGNPIMDGSWSSWTPTWTNVTIGNAVVTGKYSQVGKTVIARLNVVWGNSTSASGNIVFSLPVTAASYPGTSNVGYIGFGTMFDVSGGLVYDTVLTRLTTTTAGAAAKAANGTWVTNAVASNVQPVTWANTDEWDWTIIYEAA
jgi:hypothetical protein